MLLPRGFRYSLTPSIRVVPFSTPYGCGKHSPLAACSTIFRLLEPPLGGFHHSFATFSTSHGFFHSVGAPYLVVFPLPPPDASPLLQTYTLFRIYFPPHRFHCSFATFIVPSRLPLFHCGFRDSLAAFAAPSRVSSAFAYLHSLCHGFHYERPDGWRCGFDSRDVRCSFATFTTAHSFRLDFRYSLLTFTTV